MVQWRQPHPLTNVLKVNKDKNERIHINNQCIYCTLCNACCFVHKVIVDDRNSGPSRPNNGAFVTGLRLLTVAVSGNRTA